MLSPSGVPRLVRMTFDEYIEELRQDTNVSAHIELDRDKEVQYMRDSQFRFKRIAAAIPASPTPLRILDIGTTPFTLFLKQSRPQDDVWTLDRTELLAERCRQAGVELRACNLDDARLPFADEMFDVIVFTEVLEHVFAPPSEVLREVHRVLRPNGVLIMGVPNIARLSQRVKMLLGRSPLEPADHQLNRDWVHGHGHIHEYTRGEIMRLCLAVGFRELRSEMLSASPCDMLQGRRRFALGQFGYDLVTYFVPGWRSYIHLKCRR